MHVKIKLKTLSDTELDIIPLLLVNFIEAIEFFFFILS